jgi:hypothetical protein
MLSLSTVIMLALLLLLLAPYRQASAALYLPDALDAWESFAGSGSGKGARLYQGPYALAAIRPRPIMLDSAAGARIEVAIVYQAAVRFLLPCVQLCWQHYVAHTTCMC